MRATSVEFSHLSVLPLHLTQLPETSGTTRAKTIGLKCGTGRHGYLYGMARLQQPRPKLLRLLLTPMRRLQRQKPHKPRLTDQFARITKTTRRGRVARRSRRACLATCGLTRTPAKRTDGTALHGR